MSDSACQKQHPASHPKSHRENWRHPAKRILPWLTPETILEIFPIKQCRWGHLSRCGCPKSGHVRWCRAAALTLRHLAERDARALLPARMEGALFRALDAETDGEIAGQLRATLRTLLRIGVPSEPSYWLEVCAHHCLLCCGGIFLCECINIPRNYSLPTHAAFRGMSAILQGNV